MEQDTPEWHALRATKIGASDAPVIMGVSPWKTPYQLWQEKLGLVESHQSNVAMLRGKLMESQARKCFQKCTGIQIYPSVVLSKKYPWMMASLDGIDSSKTVAVEIKCPGRDDHSTALDGQIPEKYIPQLYHQMIVCELDSIQYFSYNPTFTDENQRTKIITLKKNCGYEESLIKKEIEFLDCWNNFREPALNKKDFFEIDNKKWNAVSEEWKEIQKSLRELKIRDEQCRQDLIAMASSQNAIGNGVKVCKFFRRGAVDYQAIPELIGIELDDYRKKPTEIWRIT